MDLAAGGLNWTPPGRPRKGARTAGEAGRPSDGLGSGCLTTSKEVHQCFNSGYGHARTCQLNVGLAQGKFPEQVKDALGQPDKSP